MDVDNSATLAVSDNMAIKRKKKIFTNWTNGDPQLSVTGIQWQFGNQLR